MKALELLKLANEAKRIGQGDAYVEAMAELRDLERRNAESYAQKNLGRIVANRKRAGRSEAKQALLNRRNEQRARMLQLLEDSKRYGYKRGWAFHEFRRHFGNFPPRCWMRLDEKEMR